MNQKRTSNYKFPLPGDQSHSAPWGGNDQVLAQAIEAIDAQLASAPPITQAQHDELARRLTAIETRLAKFEEGFRRAESDLAGG